MMSNALLLRCDDQLQLTAYSDPHLSEAICNRSASSFERDVAAAVKDVFGMEIFGFDYIIDNTTGIESISSATSISALSLCHSLFLGLSI